MSVHKALWRKASTTASAVTCGFLATITTVPVLAFEPENIEIRQQGDSLPLVPSATRSVLVFPAPLTDDLQLGKAMSDVTALGLKSTGELGTVFELIVESPFEETVKVYKEKQNVIATDLVIKPLYYVKGIENERTKVTLQNRLTILFSDETGIDTRADIEDQFGLEPDVAMTDRFVTYNVDLFSSDIPALAKKIWETHDEHIEFAEPDMGLPFDLHSSTAQSPGELDDPLRLLQWHHNNDGRTDISRGVTFDADHDINRAWNYNTRNSSGTGSVGDGRNLGYFGRPTSLDNVREGVITVAVFDSGNDLLHEDWQRNINDADPDPGGISVIDTRPGNFDLISLDPDPSEEGDSHGTAVAGIIAGARNNGTGGSGIAPDVRLLSYRVVEEGASASAANIARAIQEAAGPLGADVGNHSYGGLVESDTMRTAFNFAFSSGRFNLGMPNFTSSGNATTYLSYPALHYSTFSVGGFDRQGRKAGYASWGGKLDFVGATAQFPVGQGSFTAPTLNTEGILTMDISGPAGDIGLKPNDPFIQNGNYTSIFNGTSAASPVVAGIAALLIAENTSLDVIQLFNEMANTADKLEDPLLYVGRENNANRFQFEATILQEGELTTFTTVQKRGRPNNFRASNFEITADGWSPFYGYGSPNPYRQITQQRSNLGPRDYIFNDEFLESEDLDGGGVPVPVDHGDLIMVYASDFEQDLNQMIQDCIALINAEDPDAEIDPVVLASCLREDGDFTRDNRGDISRGKWDFVQTPLSPNGDDPGFRDVGYEFLPEIHNGISFEFDYSTPNLPNVDNIGFNELEFLTDPVHSVVITSSRETRPEEFVSLIGYEATDGDDFWNPRGRYPQNATISVTSRPASIQFPVLDNSDLPLVMDVTLRHEVGIENVVTNAIDEVANNNFSRPEFDALQVSYNGGTIGYIYGNSDNLPVFPLPLPVDTADGRIEENDAFFPNFEGALDPAIYERGIENMPFRTYRFVVPPSLRSPNLADGTTSGTESPQLRFSMVNSANIIGRGIGSGFSPGTGGAMIPESILQDDGTFEQFTAVRPGDIPFNRDYPGFEIAQIKLWAYDSAENPATGLNARQTQQSDVVQIADEGSEPDWSANANEVFFVSGSADPGSRNELRTALSDGLFQQLNQNIIEGGENFTLSVERRSNVLLLETTPEDILAPSPPITAYDADANSNLFAYIIDDPFAVERVFISNDDGFDERPLFPAINGVSRDADIIDIEFGRDSDEIFIATDTEIFSTGLDGENRDLIIDLAGSKLRSFDDLTITNEDSFIIFSAENTRGDRGLFAAIRNINIRSAPAFVLTIVDWANSDEVHPSIDPSGRYLAFASNTIDQGLAGGNSPVPPPGTLNQIYLIGNLNNFFEFGTPLRASAPQQLFRDRRSNPTLPETYAGGQYPKFSPVSNDLRIVFEAFNSFDADLGEVAITTVLLPDDGLNIIQTPFPEPDPNTPLPVVPAVAPDDQIIQISRSDFDFQGDGWTFTVGSQFGVPFPSPLSSTAGGALTLVAFNNNLNSFGLFESTNRFLRLRNSSLSLSQDDLNDHYLVRFYARRTTSDATKAGTFVGRVESEDGQNLQEVLVNPTTVNNPFMPGFNTLTTVDMFFHPNVDIYNLDFSQQTYNVFFGLQNLDQNNDPNAGFIVDRIDMYRLDPDAIEEFGTILTYDFSNPSDQAEFIFDGNGIFGVPTSITDMGGLGVSVENTIDSFGAYTSIPEAIVVNPVGVPEDLFVRMKAVISSTEANGILVPDVNLRITDTQGNFEQVNGIRGSGTADQIPTVGNPKTYYTYFPVNEFFTGDLYEIVSSFEVTSINQSGSTGSSTEPVTLKSLEFDLIQIDEYPEVDPTVNE